MKWSRNGRGRSWVWAGRATAIAVLACLAGYLAAVGLDNADKIASALGLLVAVAALVAPYLFPPRQEPAEGSRQTVTNSIVGGNLVQIQDVPRAGALGGTAGPTEPEVPRGRYVNGVWVRESERGGDGAAE
jgi:hypothetical protein